MLRIDGVTASVLDSSERSVLGAVLLHNEALPRVALEPDDFHDPRNRIVWTAMQGLASAGRAIDPLTLARQLGDVADRLAGHIADCIGIVPTSDNVEHYAAIVADAALTRRVRVSCSEIAHSQLAGEELLQHALKVILQLAATRTEGAINMGELARTTLTDVTDLLERRANGEIASSGLLTGLAALDTLTGGIQTGVLTVLGGRPSMGKSSLARTIADNVAATGVGVHVFSLEDRRSAYARRVLADRGRVDLQRLNTLRLDRGEVAKLEMAARELSDQRRWLVDDVAGMSGAQVAMRVRRHATENRTKLVVVDYAQIMREPEARRDDKRMQVAISVETLHELARKEDLAVLLISQLNRELERRDNKRPMLSDLREAGDIEQIADVVMFCYRDEVYNRDSPAKGMGEVIVAKNKHGQPSTARLAWDAPTATYRNVGASPPPWQAPTREEAL